MSDQFQDYQEQKRLEREENARIEQEVQEEKKREDQTIWDKELEYKRIERKREDEEWWRRRQEDARWNAEHRR